MPRTPRRGGRSTPAVAAVTALLALGPVAGLVAPPAAADEPAAASAASATTPRTSTGEPVASGRRGAVASPDAAATRIGLRVLAKGGNAVDAAVATAAALGVSEPLSGGLGGGGQLLRYDGRTGRVRVVDGASTAPATIPRRAFFDPATGSPYPAYPDLVTGGLTAGVPGTAATWTEALRRWGSQPLRRVLKPAAALARAGVRVDPTLHGQIAANAERFAAVQATATMFLRDGGPLAVATRLRNPRLALTYERMGRDRAAFYRGPVAGLIVDAVRRTKVRTTSLPVPRGHLTRRDLRRAEVSVGRPLTVAYGDTTVHTAAGSSLASSALAGSLRVLDLLDPQRGTDLELRHLVAEASAVGYADASAYVGDRRFVDVPDRTLLSRAYAGERACGVSRTEAAVKPVAAGALRGADGVCEETAGVSSAGRQNSPRDSPRDSQRPGSTPVADATSDGTVNLVTRDATGTVVVYSMTLQRTGGSGVVVPGAGFLLGSELAGFPAEWSREDPNRMTPGKRARHDLVPTLVVDRDGPVLALGSAGGDAAASTVLQVVVDVVDGLLPLPEAVAAPRGTQRNTAYLGGEQGFLDTWGGPLATLGHALEEAAAPEIGAVTAIGLDRLRLTAVAETERRGGGAAAVVRD